MENLLKKQLINFFVGNCGGIKYFLYLCSRNRVRQLVAMVHTTPLNGQAPNAVYGRSDAPRCSFRSKAKVNCFLHALRSDYRYTSSPPEKRIKDSKDLKDPKDPKDPKDITKKLTTEY